MCGIDYKKDIDMNIDNSFASSAYKDISATFSKKFEDNKEIKAKDISNQYLAEYQQQTFSQSNTQINTQVHTFTLADIGYHGKEIGKLTQDEAKKLVSNDGFFGIDKTSTRIADFVINGAGDDVKKLKAGREGILRGFKEAENIWGKKLPDISYKTIDKAVEMIDAKLSKLGATIVDTNA